MRRKRFSNRAIAQAALALLAGLSLAWILLGDESAASQTAAVMVEAGCMVAFLIIRAGNRRRAKRLPRCELCQRENGPPTDDMRWAREYGLDACHDCSFKMQVAFGNIGESHTERVLH